MLFNEIENLKMLSHPNILQIHETFEDDINYYIVTELCTGGELLTEIERRGSFNEQEAAMVMRSLLTID